MGRQPEPGVQRFAVGKHAKQRDRLFCTQDFGHVTTCVCVKYWQTHGAWPLQLSIMAADWGNWPLRVSQSHFHGSRTRASGLAPGSRSRTPWSMGLRRCSPSLRHKLTQVQTVKTRPCFQHCATSFSGSCLTGASWSMACLTASRGLTVGAEHHGQRALLLRNQGSSQDTQDTHSTTHNNAFFTTQQASAVFPARVQP